MSGSVESGRPTPIRTRAKSAEPSSRLSDFRPLWPARPPPRRAADVAERQVDLVVEDEHAVEVERAARRARGRRERPASFMYVCGRAARRAGRRGRCGPRSAAPANFFFGLRQLPAPRELVRDLEADVVRRAARSASPGLPSPTISQSTGVGPAPKSRQHALALLGGRVALAGGARRPRPRRPRPRRPRRPRRRARSPVSISSSASISTRGGVSVAIDGLVEVVEERDAARAP